MVVLIDMDEVLCNFRDSYIHFCRHKKWDCPIKKDGVWYELPGDQMKYLDYHWWRDLPWTRLGECLFGLCRSIFGTENLYLCSTPTDFDGCREGKFRWVQTHLPPFFHDRLILTKHKHLLAAPGRLLIDDRVENCENFIKAGGHAYVYPAKSNLRHQHDYNVAIMCHELMQMREIITRKVA
jgi:5'(3')-deoxyribonucleotidase